MGKGPHGGFHNTPGGNDHHAFADNLPDLIREFPLARGHFGKPSEKTHSVARIIESPTPLKTAEKFYRLATAGAVERRDQGGFHLAKLKDGSFITFRVVSSSPDRSPAVDLNITPPKSIKTTKIHFVKGDPK